MQTILKLTKEQSPIRQWLKGVGKYSRQVVIGLGGSAKALSLVELAEQSDRPVLVLLPNLLALTDLKEECEQYAGKDLTLTEFPVEESLASEMAIASMPHQIERLKAMIHLLEGRKGLVFAATASLSKPLLPPKVWAAQEFSVRVGDDWGSLEALVDRLELLGYQGQSQLNRPGEYARRGSIIDIFPMNRNLPIRLDFFDTEIDSLREFDPETQQSIGEIETVNVWPSQEWQFTKEAYPAVIKQLKEALASVKRKRKYPELLAKWQLHLEDLITQMENGEEPLNVAYYLSLFHSKLESLLAYLPKDSPIVVDDYARFSEQSALILEEAGQWVVDQRQEGIWLPETDFVLNPREEILATKHSTSFLASIQRGLGQLHFDAVHQVEFRPMLEFFSQMPMLEQEIKRLEKQHMTVLLALSSSKAKEQVTQVLEDFGINFIYSDQKEYVQGALQIIQEPIQSGFELPMDNLAVITERELFNKRQKRRKIGNNLSNSERLKSYTELKKGDYVVHVNHGIGIYQGIKELVVSGITREYMSIAYQDGGHLYVPIDQLKLVQKYVASESKTPKINKLGGTEWAKTKARVASKVEDIADDLIDLYAQRRFQKGYAFSKDTKEQAEFEESFGYQETPDQLRSIREIKEDMEKPKPMDRLLIGDVGYGKTEVAMRAAFKCVMDGKQVAVLTPTTILAEQHYETFKDRFKDFPFEIELMSRFRTQKQMKETIERLKKGQTAIVIGTHRVLSKDVDFLDLGLLIVDEEQRFGVRHKERLKKLKTQVDVLTLTATPIPRTLNMSMLGVRDLSVIETPPANRYPIQTYVMEQNGAVIRDAIERELARGGQVFYLSNRVETIEQKRGYIESLVPSARVGIAHGQMTERELEAVLMDFYEKELDVLVTTTIIETGIDLPNVNTLFIENADRFGLSQLYQLRGRVGRTNRLAYSYLMYQPDKTITEIGQKRLETMREFTDLGSGFKIAMRDLSIRGAGNLVGQQQHGFIDSVGYDLYVQLLKEAVDRKKAELEHQTPQQEKEEVDINLNVPAYFPSSYMADEYQKVEFYKRIHAIDGEEAYREIQDDLIDRFGVFPDEAAHLLDIGWLRYEAQESGCLSIKQKADEITVIFDGKASLLLAGESLFSCLTATQMKANVQMADGQLVLCFRIAKRTPDSFITELRRFFQKTHEQMEEMTHGAKGK
ncbi:transcription-repair coupling factor [Atopobacter sp. AH10]|uniref:transcription-repair coupling factor n=1 Tax=Atopobacter sp. AH10 TaxID=2315861 RepID=UPI000EF2598B|nr:transcription-repair coupling factor [Atopobacter sp. AH10]RLK63623.1 transcription-repair coupling factor [Atopobacter sp. AH10]